MLFFFGLFADCFRAFLMLILLHIELDGLLFL